MRLEMEDIRDLNDYFQAKLAYAREKARAEKHPVTLGKELRSDCWVVDGQFLQDLKFYPSGEIEMLTSVGRRALS